MTNCTLGIVVPMSATTKGCEMSEDLKTGMRIAGVILLFVATFYLGICTLFVVLGN